MSKDFGQRKLWDGYSASVEPTASFQENSGADDACTGNIYDSAGKVVYSTTGPGVELDPATGMDIDGDGAPDVVFMNGASGGSGGSWTIEAVSLKPKPHLLFTFDEEFPPSSFRTDSQQRVILWTWYRVYFDSYDFPNARTPVVQRIYRFENGKLKEVTVEYFAEIENSRSFPRPKEDDIEHLHASEITSGEFETFDDEDTASKVLSLVLQYIFCRRFDQALDIIHRTWPQQDQAGLIENLQETFKQRDCPDCSKGIEAWR